MNPIIRIYTTNALELNSFFQNIYFHILKDYNKNLKSNNLLWEKEFTNYNEIIDLIIYYFETNDKYKITMWISFDKDIFIKVHKYNADQLVRYIYIRYLLN